MADQPQSYQEIEREIADKPGSLARIRASRHAAKGYLALPSPRFQLMARAPGAPAKHTFHLMAQGDSWFDYFPGRDLIRCLHEDHGHVFGGPSGDSTNLAVAGSTLNDEAYGPVPTNLLGVPQSDEVSRIVELVDRITSDKPQALLLSAGGNDVAGAEFFSFIENSRSGLQSVNPDVVSGVLGRTFKTAYEYIIGNALKAAGANPMPIFVHGYDYPWPDGRGVLDLGLWKIGPWFDDSFNRKNYPLSAPGGLQVRHDIVRQFIDALNVLLQGLAQKYAGKVFYVDLRGTLKSEADWANELHPGNDGFAALADKIDAALQLHI
jgi:hypothetical protein